MMQLNNSKTDGEDQYIFLMLFTDGVRIDLSFRRANTVNEHMEDSLTKVLENSIIWARNHLNSKDYRLRCLAFVEDAYERSNEIEMWGG